MSELRGGSPPLRSIPAILIHAAIYAIVGTLSLSTAFVQPNTAAVWIPSGYATGLLLAEGIAYWPAIALGAFALNTSVNLLNDPSPMAVWGAAMIAAGNTLEALIAAHLTQRFCAGSRFLFQTRNLVRFLVLPLPLAPIASVGAGLIASGIAGLQARDGVLQVALTWYVADAAGILTSPASPSSRSPAEFRAPPWIGSRRASSSSSRWPSPARRSAASTSPIGSVTGRRPT